MDMRVKKLKESTLLEFKPKSNATPESAVDIDDMTADVPQNLSSNPSVETAATELGVEDDNIIDIEDPETSKGIIYNLLDRCLITDAENRQNGDLRPTNVLLIGGAGIGKSSVVQQ